MSDLSRKPEFVREVRRLIRREYRRPWWLAFAILIVVSVTAFAAAVVVISNHLTQPVTVGQTAAVAWNPAPQANLAIGQPDSFGVALSYTGSSSSPISLVLHLTMPTGSTDCSGVAVSQTTPALGALTGAFASGVCSYASSPQAPASSLSWQFSVTYSTGGSYSWDVAAQQ